MPWLELERWKRRDHFHFYSALSQPFFSVTAEVDATESWLRSRADNEPSFFLFGIYAALRAANSDEALRLRIRGGGVWLHDAVSIGTTIMRSDETFAFAEFHPDDDFGRFCRAGEAEIERARTTSEPLSGSTGDELIYHSTLPWTRFTSFTNARHDGDSIPRIVFGRCSPDGDRFVMPVAVEVHHGIVDGIDVARFYERLERELADCAKL